MLGPLLLKYGTEAQKAEYLPKILSGEHVWAQGYSEPDAGSDLAAVRTEAVRDGDQWVINGQKTWTTLGMDATHIFILARTDKTVKKQAGISFLLVPMDVPGVTVRPIRNLDRHEEFCEVFFDNVQVPVDSLVGDENEGWAIAKALLGHERVFIGAPRLSATRLRGCATSPRRAASSRTRRCRTATPGCGWMSRTCRTCSSPMSTCCATARPIGADVAMLKIFQSELYQRISDEMMELAGDSAGWREAEGGDPRLHAAGTWLAARPTTIFGGSTEVMRNMLARAVLDLPAG